MRTLSPALTTLLAGNGPFLKADLFTFTLSNGTVLRWWTGQTGSFTIGGNTYIKGPPISRSKAKWSMGLNVDQLKLTLTDDGSTTINTQPLAQAAWQNMLDFAQVEVDRYIGDTWTNTALGTIPWFQGTVGQIEIDGNTITITVDSALAQLKSTYPRTYILPSCVNTFCDAVCGLLESNFTHAGTVGSAPTASSFPLTLTGGNLADGTFQAGKITFTSGVNNGQVRTIKSYVGGVVTLVYPLYAVPSVGDTVSALEGCLKTRTACNNHGNLPKFRGFPYVPDPSTQYSGAGSGAPESGSGRGSDRITSRIGPRGQRGHISQF